jgi:hypothetical protein
MGKLINLLVIGFIVSTLASPHGSKSGSNKQVVSGKQYVVLADGARPIPDNAIYYKPCDKTKCAEIDRSITAGLAKLVRPNSGSTKLLAHNFLNKEFAKLSQKAKAVHTDFNGNYSFTCPTKKCLVFSSGKTARSNAFWLKVINPGAKFDLTNSSTIHSDVTPDTAALKEPIKVPANEVINSKDPLTEKIQRGYALIKILDNWYRNPK